MEPIQLGSLTIYPFGLFIAVLLVPFFFFTARNMKRSGLKKETASWFAVLAIPFCFVLARLGYSLFAIDQMIGYEDFGMALRVTEGGFLMWGAILGALLAAMLAGKITGQSGSAVSDSMIIPACLMIAAIRLLCGLLFRDIGIGMGLDYWFDPEETDFAARFSVFRPEDYSFFERFPFAVQDYYDVWCWAVFVLQALWACVTALLIFRTKAAPGGRTTRFLLLFACGSIVLESMLFAGESIRVPWLRVVKGNQLLCAAALLAVLIACLRRIGPKEWKKPALILIPQLLCAVGIIIVMEFAAFEKKVTFLNINTIPTDICHLIEILAALWIVLAFRPVWKKAYCNPAPES